jgi:hypothetical protein
MKARKGSLAVVPPNRRLPAATEVERLVLGSMLQSSPRQRLLVGEGMAELQPDDFSVSRHRNTFRAICELYGAEEEINYTTVFQRLADNREAASDEISWLTSLTDGLPEVNTILGRIRILRSKGNLRRMIELFRRAEARIDLGEPADEISTEVQSGLAAVGGAKLLRVADLPSVETCNRAREIEYIRRPELPKAAVVGLTGDAGCGKSTLAMAWARDATGIPVLILDRENPLAVVADRLRRLNWDADDPRLKYWGGWIEHEPPLPDYPAVIDWVVQCDPKPIVIVDSLSAFFGAGDQNDASIMREFLQRCRRLASLGATVIPTHHSGKAETAKDYRGSSDFPGSIDLGFHVSNIGENGALGRILLRPFKTRFTVDGPLAYDYADGRFERVDQQGARQTMHEQFTAILRLNPGVGLTRFQELAKARGLSSNSARDFLAAGISSHAVRWERGKGHQSRHYLNSQDLGSTLLE